MFKVLSDEEELESREKSFEKIKPFSLIRFGANRYFLVDGVDYLTNAISGIELTKENIELLLDKRSVRESLKKVEFDEMRCLNYCGPIEKV